MAVTLETRYKNCTKLLEDFRRSTIPALHKKANDCAADLETCMLVQQCLQREVAAIPAETERVEKQWKRYTEESWTPDIVLAVFGGAVGGAVVGLVSRWR